MHRQFVFILILIFVFSSCQHIDNKSPKPIAAQVAWQDAELGVLVCYELHTFNEGRYNQARARINPVLDPSQFMPHDLDTDQWVKAAKDAGARFAILTASHESGFRLWQSEVNDYCLKSTKWGGGKRDIVEEFMESCHKYNIAPGIYLGTRWNAELGIYDFKVSERSQITQEDYNRLIEREVEEICMNYGDWFEFWFDGGAHGPDQGGPDILSIVEKYQPNAVFYHNLQRADARWGGSESGTVPYPCWATFPYISTGAGESAKEHISANGFELLKKGDPDGSFWMPAMSDAPLRGFGGHEWFWEPGDEKLIYPLDKLVDMYNNSVGRNSTLILGITPDTTGLLPESDVIRLKELGDEIRELYGEAICSKSGKGSEIFMKLPEEMVISRIIIQENIEKGERVREYIVDCFTEGAWKTVAKGTCIGHKRIEIIEALKVSKIRLRLTEAIDRPIIKNFSVF